MSNFRLTEAKAKFGPVLIRLDNPSPEAARTLLLFGFLVSFALFLLALVLLVGNILSLLNGSTDSWTVTWTVLLSLYLINVAAG